MKLKLDRVVVYTLFVMILAFMFVLPWRAASVLRAQTSGDENCTTFPGGSGTSDADCNGKCKAGGNDSGFLGAGGCVCKVCGLGSNFSGCQSVANSIGSALSCGG